MMTVDFASATISANYSQAGRAFSLSQMWSLTLAAFSVFGFYLVLKLRFR